MIATDGIGHVARFLADHPEGIPAGKDAADRGIGFNFRNLINKCDQFVELTGEIGDVGGCSMICKRLKLIEGFL